MVGGKILDWSCKLSTGYAELKVQLNENNEVKLVRANIPPNDLCELKSGDSIWWQTNKVYINVHGCKDVPYEKMSNTIKSKI